MKPYLRNLHQKSHLILLCLVASLFLPVSEVIGQVKIQEETMTIPTYMLDAPNPMPRFYEGRSHQGVQRRIYPYPYDDGLTTNKQDKDYPFIHVQNEYIDLGIMPELGGRIYYAVDKTDNYNWFYHNHVVKPSLIGMLGNWISGSLAWGFPHHHGPNTVKPMDYKIEENADGSKTVWVSNTDRRHRMDVVLGYTIYPNSSLLEMTIRPDNRTDISNSFLFWANPAVHADSSYQVIFPPSVQYVTYHGKRDMTAWPIADSRFNNYDFTGEDVSWWKNTHVPSSFFSWDPRENYFGGYDHNKDAGTVWVGNHYVSPGMKYWADGNNARGVAINEGLTDNDGRYIELMAGFYTDNQPDYSWLQPYETKLGTMIWFPVRELGGLKYANRNGAMNYELKDNNTLDVRINTTSPHKNAKLVVKSKGAEIGNITMNISPAEPFKTAIKLTGSVKEDDLEFTLSGSDSQVILAYRPIEHHPPDYPKPEPLKGLDDPKDIGSVEELYLAGLRLNQFYNASVDPMPYYMEALKRDPGDYRVNTQLGILSLKDYDWVKAEKYLRTAVERITSNYTRPKDGEGLYYLGVALRAQGKMEEAYDCFYRASWSSAWHTASYYQLAEIDCQRGDFETALDHVNRSISTNTENMSAQNLKAIILRKLNDNQSAEQLLQANIAKSKINHMAVNELSIINSKNGNNSQASVNLKELGNWMHEGDEVQSYLELSTEYNSCGLYREGADLLSRLEKKGNQFPMLYYYLGYYWSKLGDQAKSLAYYQKAAKMPYEYCFPFRSESIGILEDAMQKNPKDAMAPYYLGNLLYDHQPERAIAEWENSRKRDDSFYIVHRNLALAYQEVQKNYEKALVSMEKAANCTSGDVRLLIELDDLYELNRVSPQKKYEFLEKNYSTAVKRSETLLRFITRSIEYGKYDQALELLSSNNINESEGSRVMQNAYLDSYTLRAIGFINSKKYDKALKDINDALAYPIGLYGRARYAQLYYLAGEINKKLGNSEKANDYFQKTLDVEMAEGRRGNSDREYNYYKGLAFRELGNSDEAMKLFREMLDNALNSDGGRGAFFTQFEGGRSSYLANATNHYIAGLAYAGMGDKENAGKEFSEALKINPAHIWSRTYLENL